jgi:transcriptional regulator with XRE-family HTH domain
MLTQSAPSTFGDLLRQHRQTAGLTQQELAERAGLSVHGIQKLERGATRPYRDTAQRLIVALRLGAEDRSRFHAAVAPVRRHTSAPRGKASDGAVRHNLPSPTTSLVGREDATVEIRRRLAGTRLLTLTGVGGCGKTRLALEVARTVVEDNSDGVWLVELGPLADPSLVPQRVAIALEVREKAEEPLTTALANALRDRHLLLVLDNCEHLLDACAQLVDDLLKACPGLSVLTTSREPIGIRGEVAWRVPSLAVPDPASTETLQQLLVNPAVQLFVQQALAAQPRFMLTARNKSAVVQICRRLDGIPLALELAAARIEALTAEQISARLDQRFRLLTGGSRAAMPRQQTLAATLDWSYDLLAKPSGGCSNDWLCSPAAGPLKRLKPSALSLRHGWTLDVACAARTCSRCLRALRVSRWSSPRKRSRAPSATPCSRPCVTMRARSWRRAEPPKSEPSATGTPTLRLADRAASPRSDRATVARYTGPNYGCVLVG